MSKKAVLISRKSEARVTQIKPGDMSTLYKRCGFRSSDNFECLHKWNVNGQNVCVYGRQHGRATLENKTELPPPVDKVLLYGSMVITLEDEKGELVDLTVKRWESISETLFGGFEDLESTRRADEEEEDELLDLPPEQLTKTGYLKDGWIVDDDAGSGLEEEEYVCK